MYNIFGVRGQRAASGLFQAIWNGSDKMQAIIDKENSSDGWTEDTINKRSKTPQGRIDALNASIDNLKVGLGNAMTVFTPLITGMSKLFNWISEISTTGIGGFIVKLVTSATIVTTLVSGFSLIRGTLRMVTTIMGSLTATAAAASTATASMNTGAAMLEAHLRTIVALMAEYVALSYAPGTKGMMLPMGGRLGRNKAGKPYVGGFGKKGGAMSTATYSGAYIQKPTSGGSTGGSTGGGSGVASKGLGLAGMASMMLGGPWGIGLGIALTGLSMGLDYYMNSVDANTEAVNANTQELSAQEIQSEYNERYVKAIEQAIKAGGTNTNSLNLTINGTSLGTFRDGDSVPIDGYGFYY